MTDEPPIVDECERCGESDPELLGSRLEDEIEWSCFSCGEVVA